MTMRHASCPAGRMTIAIHVVRRGLRFVALSFPPKSRLSSVLACPCLRKRQIGSTVANRTSRNGRYPGHTSSDADKRAPAHDRESHRMTDATSCTNARLRITDRYVHGFAPDVYVDQSDYAVELSWERLCNPSSALSGDSIVPHLGR
ncbi:hypothetical protein Bphy_6694 (plasmid) [Paraburkholderia phymatum STM815]|uniref:Uncharacterized protein n=1 Tax=Paraburkholderia phymatum (strain DSM 17167 / CIP 108236 / LMG 21445 / STM815) TaxID=391038 RepID=B2JT16_PARP8|nr:hypothetical protein Bphy_6694 [Paraburkholderia phymatum STM815]